MAQFTVVRERARQDTHWEYLVPIVTVHLLACLAFLPWCFSWSGLALALGGTMVFGTLGINLCYHRLLAHRSLKVPKGLERSLATIALCSLEDTPVRNDSGNVREGNLGKVIGLRTFIEREIVEKCIETSRETLLFGARFSKCQRQGIA